MVEPSAVVREPDVRQSSQWTFCLVREPGERARIREDWDVLARRSGKTSPFMVWDWLEACLSARPDWEPVYVVGMVGRRIEVAWPLARRGRLPGRRRLVCAGVGPSDYQGVLLGSDAAAGLRHALDLLVEQRTWDFLDLTPLDTHQKHIVEAALASRDDVIVRTTRIGVSPYIVVDGQWEERVESSILKDVRYQWRRLARAGMVDARQVIEPAEQSQVLEWLIDRHLQKRLSGAARRTDHVVAVRRQIRAQADAWGDAGLLRIHCLRLNGALLAAHLGAQTSDRFYYYLPVFAAEYQHYSPGKVLLWRLLHEISAQGIPRFDLLRGDEPYKRQWGAVRDEAYWRVCAWRNSRLLRLLPTIQVRLENFMTRHPDIRRLVRSAGRHAGA